jgi:hypothetical protein
MGLECFWQRHDGNNDRILQELYSIVLKGNFFFVVILEDIMAEECYLLECDAV